MEQPLSAPSIGTTSTTVATTTSDSISSPSENHNNKNVNDLSPLGTPTPKTSNGRRSARKNHQQARRRPTEALSPSPPSSSSRFAITTTSSPCRTTAVIETFEDELELTEIDDNANSKNQDDDLASIDYDFEAYKQEYYERKARQTKDNNRRPYHPPTLRCSQNLCRIVTAAILVQLLIGIILLVVYFHLAEGYTASKEAAGSGNIVEVDVTLLSPPPGTISMFCSRDKMENQAAREICEKMCSPAECCRYSYLDTRSCWSDNLEACKAYQDACAVLQEQEGGSHHNNPNIEIVYLNPPPEGLDLFCDRDVFLENPAARDICQDMCSPAECCQYSDLDKRSCWSDMNHESCRAYQDVCAVLQPQTNTTKDDQHAGETSDISTTTIFPNALVLWQNPQSLPPAPEMLVETCSVSTLWSDGWNSEETTGAAMSCHEACNVASCCWDMSLTEHPADRCWTHPNCLSYALACSVLLAKHDEKVAIQEEESTMPDAPWNISKYCDPVKIKNSLDDLLTCQSICLPVECCWNTALVDHTCESSEMNRNKCGGYGSTCSVLNDPFEPQLSSSTTSSSPSLESGSGGGSSNGAGQISDITTTTVFPNALVLWGNPQLLPPAPNTLSKSCAESTLWTDGWNSEETTGAVTSCHEACNVAACCWDMLLTEHPADRCLTHPNCWSYALACSVLLAKHDEKDTIQEEESTMPDAPWNISEYCHPEKIKTSLDDLLACQSICLPVECCWNKALVDHNAWECPEMNLNKCGGYVYTCSVLNDPFEPPLSSSTTNSSSLESGQVSDHGGGGSSSSALDNQTTIVTSDSDINNQDYSAETIRDACLNHDNTIDKERGRATLCEQVCQPGSCCFDDSGVYWSSKSSSTSASPCPAYLPGDYCDKYAACEIIYTPTSAADTKAQVELACNNLEDLSDCVNVCAAATCCFTNNPWRACSATDQNNMVCTDYIACEILYGGEATTAAETVESPIKGRDRNDGERRHRRLLRAE